MVFISSQGRKRRHFETPPEFRQKPDTFKCKYHLIRPKPRRDKLLSNTRTFKSANHGTSQYVATCCIKYDDDYFSNKHVKYRCLQSKLIVNHAEYTIDIPVRENFRSVPSDENSICWGHVFVNNIHPIILQNDKRDLVSHWRLVLLVRRSYKQNYFDAHVSLSCAPAEGAPKSATAFVKLELQVLNHFKEIHRSIRANEIQAVSDRVAAKYDFPMIINLSDLQDRSKNLLIDGKTYFKIFLTYATGYQTISSLYEQSLVNLDLDSCHIPQKSIPFSRLKDVGIFTNGRFLSAHSHVLLNRCPFLASEVFDKAIHMETFSDSAIAHLLNFLNTGVLEKHKALKNLPELIQLAHKYNLPELKNMCFSIWIDTLTVKTAAELIVFTFVYGASKSILFKIQEFVFRNGTAIKKVKSTNFFAKKFPLAFVHLMFGPLKKISMITEKQNHRGQSFHSFLNQAFGSAQVS